MVAADEDVFVCLAEPQNGVPTRSLSPFLQHLLWDSNGQLQKGNIFKPGWPSLTSRARIVAPAWPTRGLLQATLEASAGLAEDVHGDPLLEHVSTRFLFVVWCLAYRRTGYK